MEKNLEENFEEKAILFIEAIEDKSNKDAPVKLRVNPEVLPILEKLKNRLVRRKNSFSLYFLFFF